MSTHILDDTDEFENPHFQFWWGLTGTGKTDTRVLNNLYGPNLKEKVPSLFKYQEEALLNFGEGERVSEAVLRKAKAGKGLPKARKTPLLCNTPRTTPETAKYLPNRQHSTDVILHSEPLNDNDEWEPKQDPFLSRFQSFRFDEGFLRQRLNNEGRQP